jgi:transposase
MHSILPVIPLKANRREPVACDFRHCRERDRIERMPGHLKHQRRIGTRYDKAALSFASFLNFARSAGDCVTLSTGYSFGSATLAR